jgi:hypothetical protein
VNRAVFVLFGCAAVATVMVAPAATSGTLQTRVNPDAAVISDFQNRIKAYVALRAKADNGTPPLKETKDPREITAAEKARATRIRAARAGAKRGDIFTPEIEKKFRTLLVWETTGPEGAKAKAAVLDEKPMVPLVVNAEYPKEQPLSTVPPAVLKALPALPEGLEYRFVRTHLILHDTQANLIVDFILNVLR